MRVVPLRRPVFRVMKRDGNAARLFFRRVVNLVNLLYARPVPLRLIQIKDMRNCRGESRLAVVHMPDGADINVRLVSLKFF